MKAFDLAWTLIKQDKPIATIGPSYREIQRVLTKLMSGEPLTPEEEVILNQQRTQL